MRNLSIDAGTFAAWFVEYLILIPVILGLVTGALVRARVVGKALGRIGMSSDVQLPTAWDYALRPGRPGAFVRVYLKTGRIVAGRLGTESLAGVSPHAHDLFLEAVFELDDDGWFASKLASSAGAWIGSDQISHVEFFTGS